MKNRVAVPFIKLVTGRGKADNAKHDEFDQWCFQPGFLCAARLPAGGGKPGAEAAGH